jgi:chromosome segregation ATPase
MTEDTTKQPTGTDSEKLTLILTTVQALTGRVDKVVDDISELRNGQNEMRVDISKLREGQIEMRADISKLREGQIESRTDILQLLEGQRALSTEVRALRRDIDHSFGNVYTKLVEIEIDHRDVHDRVTRLELNTNPPNTQT